MREVEVAACEEMDGPTEDELEAIRAATFTVEEIDEREKVTDHDTAAFVDVLAASAGPAGRWIHYGLTSSDVLDTGLALQLRRVGEIVLPDARSAGGCARREGARARAHAVRRAHPRDPRRADDVRDQARRLRVRGRPQRAPARAGVRPGERSGRSRARSAPTRRPRRSSRNACWRDSGSSASRSPPRSSPATATPSCCRRSRWPAPGSSASRPSSATSRGPRSGEVREPFARRAEGLERDAPQAQPDQVRAGQPGSRACCAATPRPALENVALWHERDISHSSVERMILPDSTILLDHLQRRVIGARGGDGRRRRADAREPRADPRRAVLPARAARARGDRASRATTPTGSSSGSPSRRSTSACRCASCSPRTRPAAGWTSTRSSTTRRSCATPTRSSTGSTRSRGLRAGTHLGPSHRKFRRREGLSHTSRTDPRLRLPHESPDQERSRRMQIRTHPDGVLEVRYTL